MGSLEEEFPYNAVTCVQFLLYHFCWAPAGTHALCNALDVVSDIASSPEQGERVCVSV